MPLLKPSFHPLSPAECSSEAFASLGKCESQSYAFNLNYCVKEIPETMPLILAQGQILPERLEALGDNKTQVSTLRHRFV